MENAKNFEYSLLAPGTRVDVRTRFEGSWANGFEIADNSNEGYVLKRLSDGSLIPMEFPPSEVRESPSGFPYRRF